MQQNNELGQAVMRGLLLGGSIGLIAGWFGMHPLRALLTGFVCGILAGVTKYRLDNRKP
ncbi:hypothetical protein [Desulfoplanes formicivorans]|uniref:Uncharacterized protein n=1 Tax=Desulfoplanes formicivorans TaxID=1592317 RepID=A0A194AGM8_9BACT|nr:hypothetical protein [Desulfoplanes formicivorans]GAU09232.1 hypothetical protein DPF_1954 [Desulfoplanes formicivorans]